MRPNTSGTLWASYIVGGKNDINTPKILNNFDAIIIKFSILID